MDWKHLFNIEKAGFYTRPLMELTCLIVILLYYSTQRKEKSLIYVAIISISSFIQCLFSDYDILTHGRSLNNNILNLICGSYLLIEFICCLLFIKSNLQSRIVKKIILSPIILLAIIVGLRLAKIHMKFIISSGLNIFFVEGFLMIAACFYFFYEVAKRHPFIASPKFAIWTIVGILIFFSFISPFYIFVAYLLQIDNSLFNQLYLINYVAYILLFASFAKAIVSAGSTPSSRKQT